ncbi:hypothetical protein DsansV1_C13g0117881 [Dioscorea sansibarensis]
MNFEDVVVDDVFGVISKISYLVHPKLSAFIVFVSMIGVFKECLNPSEQIKEGSKLTIYSFEKLNFLCYEINQLPHSKRNYMLHVSLSRSLSLSKCCGRLGILRKFHSPTAWATHALFIQSLLYGRLASYQIGVLLPSSKSTL